MVSHQLCHLSQPKLLDFSGRGLWYFCENDVARTLVTREVVSRVCDQLLRRGAHAGLELDESARRLAPFLVGLGDDRDDRHRRMPVERLLHLDRRDVLAAGDDDVLRAVFQLDVAVGMEDAEIERLIAEGALEVSKGQ